MGTIRIGLILVIVSGVLITSQCQIDDARNSFAFADEIDVVEDSVLRMEELVEKFPRSKMVNYYVDNDGHLYLNSAKLAPLKGAINNTQVRKDIVFRNFKPEEIDEFFYLMAFLWKNRIYSCHSEPGLNRLVFSYDSRDVRDGKDLRLIMTVAGSPEMSENFTANFKVLDSRGKLILFSPR